ncbi:MAG: hypothetical protein VB059_05235, partial [Raineyella sp.]|nr:hypothetical protein [Raineyella sp.]
GAAAPPTGGRDGWKVIYAEKRREEALRALGWEVVRWGWEDLNDPAALAARIRAAQRRGRLRAQYDEVVRRRVG